MNSAFELHDSTLSGVSESDGSVTVALRPAYLHKSPGRPGTDAGTGWRLDLDLRFSGASVEGLPVRFPVEIADGSLRVGGVEHANVVPLPIPAGAPAELVLILETSSRLVVRGSAVASEPRREAEYVEEFSGGQGG